MVAVDPGLGVVRDCTDQLPRLGPNSLPLCQVGADCTVPGAAAEQIVEAVVDSACTGRLWVAPQVSVRWAFGERDQGCLRLARLRLANVSWTPVAEATAARDYLPAADNLGCGSHSSGRTVVYPSRSSVPLLPRPCVP